MDCEGGGKAVTLHPKLNKYNIYTLLYIRARMKTILMTLFAAAATSAAATTVQNPIASASVAATTVPGSAHKASAASASAPADASSAAPTDTSRVVDLDEVVVVAQPKEGFALRRQPLASTVVTEREMLRTGADALTLLAQHVPSFAVPQYGARLTSSMYVRGIGSRINNPAVGVYYDNIPLMSKSAFNTHFTMVDRADVLRGPQSTLYGQNTEGGLVRLYSKNPMNYQGTDLRLGLGTGLYSDLEVAHHHRPSERLAFSVAAYYTGLRGYFDNQNFSDKNDLTNEAGGKLRLLWQATDRLRLDWTADYQYVNQNGFGYGEYHPLPWTAADGTPQPADNHVADAATTIMNGYKRNLFVTGLTLTAELPRLLLTSTSSYQLLRDEMLMDQDYLAPDYLRLSQRQKQHALTEELVLRSRDAASRWQHATGLFAARQWLRTDAPVTFGPAITQPISNAITQAMTLSMIQAMTGRYIGQGMTPEEAAQMARQTVERMGITMQADMAVPEHFRTPETNLGIFHETNLSLTDRLRLTLGLRLNHDHVSIHYDALAYMALTGGTAERTATYRLTSHVRDHRSKTYTQLLPKLGITYTLDQHASNLYATLSKGYRMGGYNIQMFSDILQADLTAHQADAMQGDYDVEHSAADYDAICETIAYKPEESWNFELGTHLNLLGGRLHADVALYYMLIRNQQLSVMSYLYNYGRIMTNAGRSHSLGAEISLRGQAFRGALDWAVTYAFTSAKFDDYDSSNPHYVASANSSSSSLAYDHTGRHVPFVPQHQMSLLADWHANQRLTLGLNLTGQGRTWWDEANTFSQNFYALLGAHVDYDFGPCQVSLWGRNLTDTHYNTFAVESAAASAPSAAAPTSTSTASYARYFAQRGNPLSAGISLRLHF